VPATQPAAERQHHQPADLPRPGPDKSKRDGEQPGNRVSLSYRGATLTRPKPANLERLERAREEGRVTTYLESQVRRIDLDRVVLDHRGEEVVLPNDHVFVFAGGILPTAFLEKAGIKILTHFGKRVVEKPNASTR